MFQLKFFKALTKQYLFLNWSKWNLFVCVQKVKKICDIIKHFWLRPETHRQATQHACLPRLLGEGDKKSEKVCGEENNIFYWAD
jgi:hypothetical protein